MPDLKITQLTELTTVDPSDLLVVVDDPSGTPITKKATVGSVVTATSWVVAGSWTHSVDVANVEFTGLGVYGSIEIQVRNVSKSVSGNTSVVVSTDNGSTFFTTNGDYVTIAVDGQETNVAGSGLLSVSAAAARSGIARIQAINVNGAGKTIALTTRGQINFFVASTSPVNAIRIFNPSGGNLTGGSITILGSRI